MSLISLMMGTQLQYSPFLNWFRLQSANTYSNFYHFFLFCFGSESTKVILMILFFIFYFLYLTFLLGIFGLAAHGLQSYISLIEEILSCMYPYIFNYFIFEI